jgi:hypothetical protein
VYLIFDSESTAIASGRGRAIGKHVEPKGFVDDRHQYWFAEAVNIT